LPSIEQDLDTVRSTILDVTSTAPAPIRTYMTSLVTEQGKMLRPGLFLLCSKAGNTKSRKPNPKIAKLAAAIEILHIATLIHDDVIDQAATRRGKPSAHTVLGHREAVLLGDFLFSQCFSLVAESTSMDHARLLSRVVGVICTGEIEQSLNRYNTKVTERMYLRRIMSKTAVLFSLSCYVGAREGKANETIASTLRRFGYDIGMGFQIIDDILDLESNDQHLGKPAGSDLSSGIFTLPVIHTLRRFPERMESLLSSLPNTGNESEIMSLVRESEGIAYSRQWASRYANRASRALEALPDGAVKAQLEEISSLLLSRTV